MKDKEKTPSFNLESIFEASPAKEDKNLIIPLGTPRLFLRAFQDEAKETQTEWMAITEIHYQTTFYLSRAEDTHSDVRKGNNIFLFGYPAKLNDEGEPIRIQPDPKAPIQVPATEFEPDQELIQAVKARTMWGRRPDLPRGKDGLYIYAKPKWGFPMTEYEIYEAGKVVDTGLAPDWTLNPSWEGLILKPLDTYKHLNPELKEALAHFLEFVEHSSTSNFTRAAQAQENQAPAKQEIKNVTGKVASGSEALKAAASED